MDFLESLNFWGHRVSDLELSAWEETIGTYALLFAIVWFSLELVIYAMRKQLNGRLLGDAAANVVTQLLFIVTGVVFYVGVLALFYSIYPRYSWTQIPTNGWTIALAILLADFAYYWEHRFTHRTGIGWASHTVHHSSAIFNISTAYRFGPLDAILGVPLVLPMVFLGFSPILVLFAVGAVQLYQLWLHTEIIGKLPRFFEFVFNTPSHHRVHHGSNAEYLDRNYGGILILWDRLFGTFAGERAPLVYGVLPPLRTLNPLRIWLHGFARLFQKMRRAPSVSRGLLALVLPPDQPLAAVPATESMRTALDAPGKDAA